MSNSLKDDDELSRAREQFGVLVREKATGARAGLSLAVLVAVVVALGTGASAAIAIAGGLLVAFIAVTVTYDRKVMLALARVQLAAFDVILGSLLRFFTKKRESAPRRPRQPLKFLDRVAYTIASEKTYTRLFKPMRADLVHDWNNAIARNESFRRWWITWVRSPWTLFCHVVGYNVSKLVAAIVGMIRGA